MSRTYKILIGTTLLSFLSFQALAQTCSPPPTCGVNQVSKWNGTGWTCVTFSCRIAVGAAGTNGGNAVACNNDEVVTGGGALSEVPGSALCAGVSRGFLHATAPTGAPFNGWWSDSFKNDWTGEACVRSFAVCCKIQ